MSSIALLLGGRSEQGGEKLGVAKGQGEALGSFIEVGTECARGAAPVNGALGAWMSMGDSEAMVR